MAGVEYEDGVAPGTISRVCDERLAGAVFAAYLPGEVFLVRMPGEILSEELVDVANAWFEMGCSPS